jgi:hypothetical protein
MPRALELVQFLSIYCTSLSSRQQTRVSEFQIASFTHSLSSKAKNCDICPGVCISPSLFVLPTFVLISCLLSFCLIIVIVDAYNTRKPSACASPIQDRLLEETAASRPAAADSPSSLRWTILAFCARYSRSLIETCSSYVLMPCTFVFVLNVWPSSFAQADSSERAMIIMLPFMTLLFRVLVIRQRVVDLTFADQKQLYASSVCSCVITAVLSASFARNADARESAPSFATDNLTQCIVLGLLIVQVITQTVIRCRATHTSIFDNTDWPWSRTTSRASSSVFSFELLTTRLLAGSIKSASSSSLGAAAKFFLLNYVALSQMAMVVAGLASASASSPSSIETSSVFIGIIPLITSGVLLLHNAVKFIWFLWRKCCRRSNQTGSPFSSTDSVY